MEKLTKEQAWEILNSIDLPESLNRVTLLATETKSERQNILLDPYHEDREIAAAIEIQRVWKGYFLRCRLYNALEPKISLETQVDSICHHHKLSQLSSSSSGSSSCTADVAVLVTKASSTSLHNNQNIAKSSSRLKLEESYTKYSKGKESILFEDYCALIIQSWWHQVCEDQKNLRVPSVRPPTLDENYSSGRTTQHKITSQLSGASSAILSGVLTRKDAARVIQRAWRRHIDIQVYLYYRDLISFKFHGDPALLLRCINPREAELLDSASGTHVKFRLAGKTFPPNIYYKIFTHRPVVDLGANSPKDYTKASAKRLVARQCHNKEQPVLSQEGEKEGWYQRWENNGWRLVSDRIIGKIDQDAVTYDSAQKKMEFKHLRILRIQDVEKNRKKKKIQWMKKMYRNGMLWTKQGTALSIEREIENSVKGLADMTDKLGHSALEEWEVDELLEWTNGLNFDRYVTEWKEFGTSARSDQGAEKHRFFPEEQLPITLSR